MWEWLEAAYSNMKNSKRSTGQIIEVQDVKFAWPAVDDIGTVLMPVAIQVPLEPKMDRPDCLSFD